MRAKEKKKKTKGKYPVNSIHFGWYSICKIALYTRHVMVLTDNVFVSCAELDYCGRNNPCKNGTCRNTAPGRYRCFCKTGYGGLNCDTGNSLILKHNELKREIERKKKTWSKRNRKENRLLFFPVFHSVNFAFFQQKEMNVRVIHAKMEATAR